MPDPATQFQQAGLSVPYQFQPSQYHPQYVNVPTQAGQLWGEVGKNAMSSAATVFDAMSKSPLRPDIKQQMLESRDRAIFGQNYIKWLQDKAHPERMLLGSEGATGAATTPAVSAGESFAPTFVPEKTPPPPAPGPKNTKPTVTTLFSNGDTVQSSKGNPLKVTDEERGVAQDQNGNPWYYHTGTNTWESSPEPETQPQQSSSQPNQSNMPGSTTSLLQQHQHGGYVFAQPVRSPPPPAPGAVRLQEGGQVPLPPGTYPQISNDPTAVIDPRTGEPNRAIASDQGGAQGPSPQDLAAWQARNAHPVASPSAVQDWYKHNVSTDVSGVTYSATGGVRGEPGFIIKDKKGNASMISASQIARTPSGAALLTNANPSELLEHQNTQAEAAAQQQAQQYAGGPGSSPATLAAQQQAQQYAGGQPPGPPAPPQYPTITSGQTPGPAGPPAAPGQGPSSPQGPLSPQEIAQGQLPQEEFARRLAAATHPPLSALTASTTPTSTATEPAREPIATSDNERNAATDVKPGDTDEGGVPKDPHGDFPWYARKMNLTWYWDPARGQAFSTRPEDAQHPFLEQRLWMTSPQQWERDYATPENALRQQVYDYFMGPHALQSNKAWTIKTIADMDMPTLQAWLLKGRELANTKTGDASDADNLALTNRTTAINSAQRLQDMVTAVGNHPEVYSRAGQQAEDTVRAGQQTARDPSSPLGQLQNIGAQWNKWLSGSAESLPITKDIQKEVGTLAETLKTLAAQPVADTEVTPRKSGNVTLVGGTAGGALLSGIVGMAQSMRNANKSDEEINDAIVNRLTGIFDGQKPEVTKQRLQALQNELGTAQNRQVTTMELNQKRVPQDNLQNYETIKNHQRVPDVDNRYWHGEQGKVVDPWNENFETKGTPSPTPTPTPSPTPAAPKPSGMTEVKSIDEMRAFGKEHPGQHVWFNGQEYEPK